MKDKLKGGKADKKKLSSFSQKELKAGAKVEMEEHTKDKQIAREIAADHLTESPEYYKDLAVMESKMKKVEEKMPDGSVKRAPGKELLEKEPSLLKSRWNVIKEALQKAVVSNSAIPDMKSLMAPAESEAPAQPDDTQQQPPADDAQPDASAAPAQDDGENAGDSPDDTASQQDAAPEQSQDAEQPQEDMSDDELIAALKEEGYTDQEIGFVLWGHHMPTDALNTVQDHAHEMAQIDPQDPEHDEDNREHAKDHMKAMRDVELSHAKAKDPTPDLQMMREHKKAMLEMEREKAKKMMEMELKHKEHELQAKRLEIAQKAKQKPEAPKPAKKDSK
jgi:hypothetical protein